MTGKIIYDELDRRLGMSHEDKNYLRYFMLRLLPDDYLVDVNATDVFDPSEIGLTKVSRYLREMYPYKPARPAVENTLKNMTER